MNMRRGLRCVVCGHYVPAPKRGFCGQVHPKCRPWADVMTRLDRMLGELQPHRFTHRALAELRQYLFRASTEIPRLRGSDGRFVSLDNARHQAVGPVMLPVRLQKAFARAWPVVR